MNKENCLNCKFFRSEYAGYGDCRRYPPSVCSDSDADSTQSLLAIFPHVPEKDWCGEFKPINQEEPNDCGENPDTYQIMQDKLRADILKNIDRIFGTSQD